VTLWGAGKTEGDRLTAEYAEVAEKAIERELLGELCTLGG